MALDILYPVRPGDDNDELRWSLRTVERNYPHGQIWVVGHRPPWLQGVNFIPGNSRPYRQANLYHNILAACEHPDTPQQMVVFNDDFFITEPVQRPQVYYRGSLREHLGLPRIRGNPYGWWATSLQITNQVLLEQGSRSPLSYELHVPLPIDTVEMADTLRRFAHVSPENPPQWRTLYGNLHHLPGVRRGDCKVTYPGEVQAPYHSTSDRSWRAHFASIFQDLYPDPSRYERS